MRHSKRYHSLPYEKRLKERAAALRKAGMIHEVQLWKRLKKGKVLGLDFDRQKIVGPYIVDFYCAERQVVIEVDGPSHVDRAAYDARRDKYLNRLGLTVIRIAVHGTLFNIESVVEFLENHPALTGTPPKEGN